MNSISVSEVARECDQSLVESRRRRAHEVERSLPWVDRRWLGFDRVEVIMALVAVLVAVTTFVLLGAPL